MYWFFNHGSDTKCWKFNSSIMRNKTSMDQESTIHLKNHILQDFHNRKNLNLFIPEAIDEDWMEIGEDVESFLWNLQTLTCNGSSFLCSFPFTKLSLFSRWILTIKYSREFCFFTGGEKWVAHLQKDPLKINLSIMVSFLFSSDQITI